MEDKQSRIGTYQHGAVGLLQKRMNVVQTVVGRIDHTLRCDEAPQPCAIKIGAIVEAQHRHNFALVHLIWQCERSKAARGAIEQQHGVQTTGGQGIHLVTAVDIDALQVASRLGGGNMGELLGAGRIAEEALAMGGDPHIAVAVGHDAAHTGRQPHTIVRLLVDGRKLLSGETEEQGTLRSAYHQAIRQGLDGSHKLVDDTRTDEGLYQRAVVTAEATIGAHPNKTSRVLGQGTNGIGTQAIGHGDVARRHGTHGLRHNRQGQEKPKGNQYLLFHCCKGNKSGAMGQGSCAKKTNGKRNRRKCPANALAQKG